MSNKYPCVYYNNGKCQKFSDEKYNAWCDFDSCEHQTPSNGDRIRAMSDEALAEFLHDAMLPHAYWLDWLKRPAEEDT